MLLKQSYIGIDTSPEYITISKARIEAAIRSTDKDKDKDKEIEEDTQFFFDNI